MAQQDLLEQVISKLRLDATTSTYHTPALAGAPDTYLSQSQRVRGHDLPLGCELVHGFKWMDF